MSKAPVDLQMLQFESSSIPETWKVIQSLQKEQAIQFIVDALQDEHDAIKMLAVRMMEQLGEEFSDAIPVITPLLLHTKEQTRMASALALVRIGGKSVPYLMKELASENKSGRFWAAWSISLINPSCLTYDALELLESVSAHSNSTIEIMAAQEALGKITALVINL